MKKVLSLVLSVAMLMTVACSMFVVPASAEVPNTYKLLDEAYIAEGADYITINEDGTWTITGPIALAPYLTFDYTVHTNIIQQFTSTAGVSITILDRDPLANDGADDPNGDGNGYGDHWINLFGNWEGPDYYPAGEVNRTDSIKGVYDWNVPNAGWGNTGYATVRAIYITPADGGTVTMTALDLNNGIYDYVLGNEVAQYEHSDVIDLAVKDADAWSVIPVSGSRVTTTVDGDNLIFGNTAGAWPSAFIDFETPYVVDAQTEIYADFSVAKNAKTTIYLFFKDATCNEFDNGAYAVLHSELGAEVSAGNYKGYVTLGDIVPSTELCCDENGNFILTGIKIFATTADGTATPVDPAVTIRALDVLYTAATEPEPDPVIVGDYDGNGTVNMRDIMQFYRAFSAGTAMTEDQIAACDYDGNGSINMRDVMNIYRGFSKGTLN